MSNRCSFIKRNGDKCKNFACTDSDLCKIHLESKKNHGKRALTHGKYASPEVLALPEHLRPVHQHYMEDPDILNLTTLIAQQKTIHIAVMQLLQRSNGDDVTRAGEEIRMGIFDCLANNGVDFDRCNYFANEIISNVLPRVSACFPEFRLNKANTELLMNNLELISKNIERMKKIQDGFVVRVDLNHKILTEFVQEVVLKEITNGQQLEAIVRRAASFSKRRLQAPVKPEDFIEDNFLDYDEEEIEGKVTYDVLPSLGEIMTNYG